MTFSDGFRVLRYGSVGPYLQRGDPGYGSGFKQPLHVAIGRCDAEGPRDGTWKPMIVDVDAAENYEAVFFFAPGGVSKSFAATLQVEPDYFVQPLFATLPERSSHTICNPKRPVNYRYANE